VSTVHYHCHGVWVQCILDGLKLKLHGFSDNLPEGHLPEGHSPWYCCDGPRGSLTVTLTSVDLQVCAPVVPVQSDSSGHGGARTLWKDRISISLNLREFQPSQNLSIIFKGLADDSDRIASPLSQLYASPFRPGLSVKGARWPDGLSGKRCQRSMGTD
jgi:hypothetical protein